jgi:magnesium-transporting ATPase (P-type)
MAAPTTLRPGAPGLTAAEAAGRRARDGPNEIPSARPPSPLLELGRQMVHFFAVLLWVAAALAAVAGMPQLSVAIVLVVLLNGVFSFLQEYRADRAGQRLAALLPTWVTVRRDGRVQVVPPGELVVGDRVLLQAGDRVSADMVLSDVLALGVDESMLTGESVPARPDVGALVFAGTYVLEGRAEADVVATGGRTMLAGIAAETRETHRPTSPLTRELDHLVRVIAGLAVAVGVLFFVLATLLGLAADGAFLLAVGVTVALVPEGLLPTVTLSLARGAQRMASQHALVRRLESVETLGATTFICSDKTGTLTRNEMTVVRVWTPVGTARISGSGYDPVADVDAAPAVRAALEELAVSAHLCSTGRVRRGADGRWAAEGDPMEAALHALALRLGIDVDALDRERSVTQALPFDPRRRRESVVAGGWLHVKGAPDAVVARCPGTDVATTEAVTAEFAAQGLRVLAVAQRPAPGEDVLGDPDTAEQDLTLIGLVALEDPPREGVGVAVARCRRAGIRLALVTGDHPATARAIAAEVGLLTADSQVLVGADLPADDAELGQLLDHDGTVVARVTPEDKLRIARSLQLRGHVVAMTGDGVNDGPALREADIGVAMGRSGTDVAREAADLVLLDDAFPTIVSAVELGRATAANIRRFLTYHLTDNVAELTPFALYALSGGKLPLALTVLMVLALDIGTDLLPALALGAEPPDARTLERPPGQQRLVDGSLLRRAFGVLGPVEALVEMTAFVAVLVAGGWRWGEDASGRVLLAASGAAFAAVVLGQMGNAFACRSERLPAWRLPLRSNGLLVAAVGVELLALALFLLLPPLAETLELRPPTLLGWGLALLAPPAVLGADAVHKALRRAGTTGSVPGPSRLLR